ncbi:hypothetical protein F444_16031, partial [Phytophthora nicotianae P1976]
PADTVLALLKVDDGVENALTKFDNGVANVLASKKINAWADYVAKFNTKYLENKKEPCHRDDMVSRMIVKAQDDPNFTKGTVPGVD